MPSFNDLTLKAQAVVFSCLIGLFSLNAMSKELTFKKNQFENQKTKHHSH
jgi:hypothetical protein